MKADPERAQSLRHIVTLALDEDLDASGDITSKAVFSESDTGSARIVTRETCVVSGMAAAAEVCLQVDPDMTWLPLVEDSQRVPEGAELARLEGRLIPILAAERTLLNFLSRLSGVATLTSRYVEAVKSMGARIAATRKTTPGLRLLEKQAVVDGGGESHRLGLYDAVLIKDNHIAAAGGVGAAIERVSSLSGIEVEVDDLDQLAEALDTGVERILLDNMTPGQVRECSRLVDTKAGQASRPLIEASGGITLENVREYAEAGADIISIGALTRAAPGIDLTLEVTQ